MNLKEFRDSYQSVTGKASDVVRTTNYSLIAMIWILSKEDIGKLTDYRCVLICITVSLGLDYLQYVITAIIGTWVYRKEEQKVEDKSKVDATLTNGYPECTPYISICFFILKIIFAVIAIVQLIFAIKI